MLTDTGTLDDVRIAFHGATATGAYVASGRVRDPRLLLLVVSQFRDTLTISSNVSRALPVEQLLDRMLETLAGDEEAPRS